MKALTWKNLFATLNPSPVFEAVAIFAEGLAMNSDAAQPMKIAAANAFAHAKPKEETAIHYARVASEPFNPRSDHHES